ncbi:predicted protein [Lichtheimia corymbifera JMRC:FSU:9682]|uniref:Uncharacterized protein n=1 Tax=Lichtheimia corymbifera JMRC:FSU:9682 TaxID=1263082 RepID=A0A068S284_9FUNG|nr:predicted protein [Lichtheimia corymbifera JMRC:FSU:9682]
MTTEQQSPRHNTLHNIHGLSPLWCQQLIPVGALDQGHYLFWLLDISKRQSTYCLDMKRCRWPMADDPMQCILSWINIFYDGVSIDVIPFIHNTIICIKAALWMQVAMYVA